MPPQCKKNVSVILFDLKMDRKISANILERIFLHMSIIRPNDSTQLILLHHAETKNKFNCHNVVQATEEIDYTFDVKQYIENCETSEGDWLDGFAIAIDILTEYKDMKAVFTKQLIYLSDCQTDLQKKSDQRERVKKVIELLNSHKIFLYIVGPETEPSITVCQKEDVKESMSNFQFKDENSMNNNNGQILKEMFQYVDGIVCGTDLAIDFLTFHVNNIPKQSWLVPLKIEDFEFPTATTKTVTGVSLPQIKMVNKPQVRYMVLPETSAETPEEIDPADVVKVYSLMDKIITLPEDISESFKFKGNRMFKLVGFVNACEIPEMYFSGEVYTVRVQHGKPHAEAFYHLVEASHKAKKYGLALRAYNNNNAPKLYVLIPTPPDRFLMVLHAENVIEVCDEQEPKCNASEVPQDLFNSFKEYLNEISMPVLPLHPHASTGVFYNQYLKKVVEFREGRKELETPSINDDKSIALLQLESLMKSDQHEIEKKVDELPLKMEDDDLDW